MATTNKDKDKSNTTGTGTTGTTGTDTTPTVGASASYQRTVVDKPTMQTPTATYDEYYQSSYNSQMGTFTPGYEALQKSNEEYLQGFDSSVDTQTAAATSAYQQKIDAAPSMSRPLYDANAINEAVNRKKVQEGMANMGMTDSGLSSSMQTAMAIQKSNADHQVRQQERAYVQDLERAIADVVAQGESTKQAEHARINKETADYYANGIANISASAATAASDAMAADRDFALELYQTDLDSWKFLQGQQFEYDMANINHMNDVELLGVKSYYEQMNMWIQGEIDDALAQGNHDRAKELKEIEGQNAQALAIINGQVELGKAQISADQKNAAAYNDMVAGFIENGMTTNEAHIYARYNTGSYATDENGELTAEGKKNQMYDKAFIMQKEGGMSSGEANAYAEVIADGGTATEAASAADSYAGTQAINFLNTLNIDSVKVRGGGVAETVNTLLSGNETYKNMSQSEKAKTLKTAIAAVVYNNYPHSDADDAGNFKRIEEACNAFGVSASDTKDAYSTIKSEKVQIGWMRTNLKQ